MTSTILFCELIDSALLYIFKLLLYLVYFFIKQSVSSKAFTELFVEKWASLRAFITLSVEQFVLSRTFTVSTHQWKASQSTQLTEKQNTALLQICLQMKSAYVAQKKRTEFWTKVQRQFQQETECSCSTLRCHVDTLIKKRKDYLNSLFTDSEN